MRIQFNLKQQTFLALLFLLSGCTIAPIDSQSTAPPPSPMAPSTTTLLKASTTISPTSDMPPGIGESEGWIEMDLAQQKARVRQGRRIVAEYLAAAGVGDPPETTTYTGLFRVQYKEKGPVESVPGVYVTDVVMFDYTHGNAFHSRPVDKEGRVLDERLGVPITAGCVRIGESAALFDFAKLGMKVWVH